ncbi:MAG: class I SAM-dependent methyltransferase [Gemmatimonadaceae bacterium]
MTSTIAPPEEPRPLGMLAAAKYLAFHLRSYGRAAARTRGEASADWRTPDAVSVLYDGMRQPVFDRRDTLSWDEVLYGQAPPGTTVLVADRLAHGSYRVPREVNLTRLKAHVGHYTDPGDRVVEFGCGDGRNLIYLQRAFPDRDFVGLELSGVSCALARRLAERFDAKVTFHEADVTAALPAALPPRSAAMAYSCHALEQMPRIFARALANMATVSSNAIILLEPVPELWPWSMRGLVSRLRVRAIDRMRGLTDAAARLAGGGDWTVVTARRLGYGSNPLNETCEIVLRRTASVPAG